MLNVKKTLTKILGTIEQILTPTTATEVEMPFTPPCNGILLVRLRTNAQGRSYEYFNNTNPTNVEGYNVLDGYFSGIVCVTKNNEVTVSTRSNVHTGQQKYIFIPTKMGGGTS